MGRNRERGQKQSTVKLKETKLGQHKRNRGKEARRDSPLTTGNKTENSNNNNNNNNNDDDTTHDECFEGVVVSEPSGQGDGAVVVDAVGADVEVGEGAVGEKGVAEGARALRRQPVHRQGQDLQCTVHLTENTRQVTGRFL